MRRVVFILLCLVLPSVILIGYGKNKVTPVSSGTVLPAPKTETDRTFSYKENTYATAWFVVPTVQSLRLIPNFTEKRTSADLIGTYACVSAINGGFYTEDDAPLGGFTAGGSTIRQPVNNRLIDGFLWTDGKTFTIGESRPDPSALLSLQTGPIFRVHGENTAISIRNDEMKRRSVAALTPTGSLVFLTVYNPESVYEGPLLADMPVILRELEQVTGFTFLEAVNLDGGSASAFHTDKVTLQELSPVGSLICVADTQ